MSSVGGIFGSQYSWLDSLELGNPGSQQRQSQSRPNAGIAAVAFGENIAMRALRDVQAVKAAQEAQVVDTTETTDASSATAASRMDSSRINDLAYGLTSAIDHIRSKHGEGAATAVMGIVYKNLGSDAITEENLSNALLEGIRFIDSKFGVAAGDSFIGTLNAGGLNDALNSFFENGTEERFLAITNQSPALLQQNINSTLDELFEEYDTALLDNIKKMFDATLANAESIKNGSFKETLKVADKMLAEEAERLGFAPLSLSGQLMQQAKVSRGMLLDTIV